MLWKLLAADIEGIEDIGAIGTVFERRSSSDSGCFHQKGADEAKRNRR